MSNATLDTVLESVKALTPEDQQELRERLDKMLPRDEEEQKMEALHRALVASGLVKEIKTPRGDTPTERRLIEIQGKPLSETIIEERR